jgi:hypothetical protein
MHGGDPCATASVCQRTCDEAVDGCVADAAGTACPDDGSLCSSDTCDGAGSCAHVFAPRSGCKDPIMPGGSSLALVDKTPGAGAIGWRWAKGAVTTIGELGDPMTATAYALCVWDETAGVPSLAFGTQVPAGGTCGTRACWTRTPTGVKYANRDGTPDGVTNLTVGADLVAGKPKVKLKAKGAHVPSLGLPLAQDPRVIAQLVNGIGTCWEARYSTAITTGPAAFKAKSD